MKFAVSAVIVLLVASASAEDLYNQGTRAVLRVYDECNKAEFGLTACLKKKAITFIDRVARLDSLAVNEGLRIVKNENAPALKLATFVNGRTVQIELPKMSTEELGRGLEEGRIGEESENPEKSVTIVR
jgi:Protein of unknown function (DUF1676)